jgi:hypothetical protein
LTGLLATAAHAENPHAVMRQLKAEAMRNVVLLGFDKRIEKLNHLAAARTNQVIVMFALIPHSAYARRHTFHCARSTASSGDTQFFPGTAGFCAGNTGR